jgi:predicted NUDIX family NTP pyrophosphohydrolase
VSSRSCWPTRAGRFFGGRTTGLDDSQGGTESPRGTNSDEDLPSAARREFEEETGLATQPPFLALKPITQRSGKVVHARAFEGDCDQAAIKSGLFTLEWPPKLGRHEQFPEIDRAAFFDLGTARKKIQAGQEALLDELEAVLKHKLPAQGTPTARRGG